ncbi:hypothetical protein AB834_02305 [PVC group bacterium (ex Bugula neritina AB1)]|nr:hypothetical protein AB834_02305 [PVC group bacterium (ex Bugula neritina AB1)]
MTGSIFIIIALGLSLIKVREVNLLFEGINLDKNRYNDNLIEFITEDGVEIYGKYLKASSSGEKPKGIIHFSHGNDSSIKDSIRIANVFKELGYDVFLYSYRGYPESKKKRFFISEKSLYLDAEAAYEEMKKAYYKEYKTKVEDEKVFFVGHSLGASVANYLAYIKPSGGLVSMSGFSSLNNAVKRKPLGKYMRWFLLNQFNSLDRIKRIKVPKLLLHHEKDQSLPPINAEELFESAASRKSLCILDKSYRRNGEEAYYHDPLLVLKTAEGSISEFLTKGYLSKANASA